MGFLLPFSLSYMRQRKKEKKRLRLINGKCSPGTETETEREADSDRQANKMEEKRLAVQNTLIIYVGYLVMLRSTCVAHSYRLIVLCFTAINDIVCGGL